MGKTDYTKVEEALAEGLRKMEVSRLLGIADANSPKDKPKEPAEGQPSVEQRQLLLALQYELKYLKKTSKDDIYKKLGIDKSEFRSLVKDPANLTPQQWEILKGYREKISAYKSELAKKEDDKKEGEKKEEEPDPDIEKERKRQKIKRFNINDKWIPLK